MISNLITCIDPGPVFSGVCIFDKDTIVYANKIESLDVLTMSVDKHETVLIEKIEARGKIVGNSTIDTAIMCGRFKQRFLEQGGNVFFIERRQVLSELNCKKDSDIIKLLRPIIKTKPGVKVTKDAWQAAALYYTYIKL
jgi:hypothetical protein